MQSKVQRKLWKNVSAPEKIVGSVAAPAQLHINRFVRVCVCMKLFSEICNCKIYMYIGKYPLCLLHRRRHTVLRLRFQRQSQLRRSLQLEHCVRGKYLTYAPLNTHTHTSARLRPRAALAKRRQAHTWIEIHLTLRPSWVIAVSWP